MKARLTELHKATQTIKEAAESDLRRIREEESLIQSQLEALDAAKADMADFGEDALGFEAHGFCGAWTRFQDAQKRELLRKLAEARSRFEAALHRSAEGFGRNHAVEAELMALKVQDRIETARSDMETLSDLIALKASRAG